MQPLNTTVMPSSPSTIGWAARSDRSMILSRRWPRATGPWAQSPEPSGPRSAIVPVMHATATGSAARRVRSSSPLKPHTQARPYPDGPRRLHGGAERRRDVVHGPQPRHPDAGRSGGGFGGGVGLGVGSRHRDAEEG